MTGTVAQESTSILYSSFHTLILQKPTMQCMQATIVYVKKNIILRFKINPATTVNVTRDVANSPQSSPRALASAGRRRGQRSNLWGGALWQDGYCNCGHISLKAADGDHLILRPDSDGEGAGGRDAGPCRGRRRVAEGVEPGRPDGPRKGGQRAARLAARWAGRC